MSESLVESESLTEEGPNVLTEIKASNNLENIAPNTMINEIAKQEGEKKVRSIEAKHNK